MPPISNRDATDAVDCDLADDIDALLDATPPPRRQIHGFQGPFGPWRVGSGEGETVFTDPWSMRPLDDSFRA